MSKFGVHNPKNYELPAGYYATVSSRAPILLGHCPVTDADGQAIIEKLGHNNASACSDGSTKDGIGKHSFYISTNTFTHKGYVIIKDGA